MASTSDKSTPGGTDPKKAGAANSSRADLQKRAAALAGGGGGGRKPVDFLTFLKEAQVELKKTTWPTRDVLTKSTYVVLALVVAVAAWVGIVDLVATKVLAPLFTPSK